jgi:hypothetical protein
MTLFVLVAIVVAFTVVIFGVWWKLIDDTPQQKRRELGLALTGGIIGIAVFGGLVLWLCQTIAGITHEPFHF